MTEEVKDSPKPAPKKKTVKASGKPTTESVNDRLGKTREISKTLTITNY